MLDADPAYQLHGTDALKAWMQERADEAIAELADVHFDIPEPVRTIECMIAPTQTGGIYYTGPSDDFTPSGPDVVVGPQGHHRVRHVEGAHHRLPRGRARAITSRSRRRPTAPSCSTSGAGSTAGRPVTARAGRCMPSG